MRALLLVGLPVLLDALKARPVNHRSAVDLLEESTDLDQAVEALESSRLEKKEKKWNWKEASEESKTEWAIVLKRYVLADMTVYELSRHFGEALPTGTLPTGTGPTGTGTDQREALDVAQKKLVRLKSNLQRAVLDQNTSDATAADMQKSRKSNLLTVHEKRVLAEEHKREQYAFFAIEASSQDALEKATELLQALETLQAQPVKAQPSWSSIVAAPATPKPTYMSLLNVTNATQATQSQQPKKATALRGAKPTVAALYQNFEEVAKTFHGDLGTFESMQSKALTNLLAMPSSF